MIELGTAINRKLDHAERPPSDLMALVRPDRLRQLVSIELWRTNKTKKSNKGAFRFGMFVVNESERHRGQLAPQSRRDTFLLHPSANFCPVADLINTPAKPLGRFAD